MQSLFSAVDRSRLDLKQDSWKRCLRIADIRACAISIHVVRVQQHDIVIVQTIIGSSHDLANSVIRFRSGRWKRNASPPCRIFEMSAARVASAADKCIPLIISGPPRSGKSLLYSLVEGHRDISWLMDEGLFFEYLYNAQKLTPSGQEIMVGSAKRNADEFLFGIRDKQIVPPVEKGFHEPGVGSVSEIKIPAPWSENAFLDVLKAGRFESISGLWQVLARACIAGLEQEPRRYCCMMAPDYGKSAAAAVESIPEARAIFVSRDPARCLDSLKRSRDKRGRNRITWPAFAICLAELNAMANRVQNTDPKRRLVIKFEDLIRETEPIMRRIADWLGIAFDDVLIRPTVLGQTWPGASSFTALSGIDYTSAKRPIHALNQRELDLIDEHLEPYRDFFGYQKS